MRTAVICLREDPIAPVVAEHLRADVIGYEEDVFEKAFQNYEGIVAIMATGIVVRKIAPLLRDKWMDPAVVVVSPDGKFAVPLLGGHHGANELAERLAEIGMVPVLTTATEAMGKPSVERIARDTERSVLNTSSTKAVNAAFLSSEVPVYALTGPAVAIIGPGVSVLLKQGEYAIGIGCRKGVPEAEIADAIRKAMEEAGITPPEVLAYATTSKKLAEEGMIQAVQAMGGTLVFMEDEVLNRQEVATASRAGKIGLIGVAEPAALALAKHKELKLKKRKYGNVTIAIAR